MSKYGNYRLIITNEAEGGSGKMERVQKGKDMMTINFIDLDGNNSEGLFVLQLLQLHVSLL